MNMATDRELRAGMDYNCLDCLRNSLACALHRETNNWGIESPDVIRGSVEDITPGFDKLREHLGRKGKSKDVVGYNETQMSELVAAQHARELAREQRKALEESYENARRVEVISENTSDHKRSKVAENVAILLALLGMVAAILGIILGIEHLTQLVLPLGGGAIGAAGYKAAIGDRIVERQRQMKKDGYF